MKKLSLLLVSIICLLIPHLLRKILRKKLLGCKNSSGRKRKQSIAENIDLTGVDAEAFWKLYDQYEAQRQDCRKSRN